MDKDERSGAQKLITGAVSPSLREKMEAESRTWMVQCPTCHFERSVWETGGIRYKAAGNPRRLMRCPNCMRLGWHKIYKRTGPAPEVLNVPRVKPLPRWLNWTIAIGSLIALITCMIVGIVMLVFALTQPIVTVGDQFMDSLKSGDDAAAYALIAPDLQAELGSVSGLQTLVKDYSPTQWSWSNRSIRNGVGRLGGTFTYADSKTGSVNIVLRQIGDDWRIVSFSMNPT